MWSIRTRAIVAFLVCSAVARADYEETEYRLKTAGVEPALRKRIHAAINRGVAFLISTQREDGSWSVGATTWRRPSEAYTVYATLALCHANTPPARAGVKRGLAWLIPEGTKGRRNLYRQVYVAGPMAMLLVANKSHPERAVAFGDVLAEGVPKSTWWGYSTKAGTSAGGIRLAKRDIDNLSTAQFGALGLWASDRLRAQPTHTIWRRHLESLVKKQMISGSWRYAPQPPFDHGGYGYYTGTFMGLANFLLAEAGSDGGKGVHRKVSERLPEVRRRAIRALERDVPAFLQLFSAGFDRRDSALDWPYYGLYALEKAAIFVDREEIGGVRWYVEGATELIRLQEGNGSWHRGGITDTAFSLLFLLRASRGYHPTTPRDRAKTSAPVSGTKPGPKAAASTPPKKAPSVPIMNAQMPLDELRKALGAKRPSGLPTPERVDAIAALDPRLDGDPILIKEWRRQWDDLLWRVLSAAPRGRDATRTRWDALQVACARAALRGGRATNAQVTRLVLQGPLRNKKWTPSPEWWIAVLGELFPAVGDGKSARALADKLAHPNFAKLGRMVGMLRGLRLLAPRLGRNDRKELIGLIVRRFEGEEREWLDRLGRPGDRREVDWDSIGAHVMTTLRALAKGPASGSYPVDEHGRLWDRVGQFRKWGRR